MRNKSINQNPRIRDWNQRKKKKKKLQFNEKINFFKINSALVLSFGILNGAYSIHLRTHTQTIKIQKTNWLKFLFRTVKKKKTYLQFNDTRKWKFYWHFNILVFFIFFRSEEYSLILLFFSSILMLIILNDQNIEQQQHHHHKFCRRIMNLKQIWPVFRREKRKASVATTPVFFFLSFFIRSTKSQ